MDVFQFINNYNLFVDEIESAVKPEFKQQIEKLRQTDPYDLVRPQTHLLNSTYARGFVWTMFVREIKG